MANLLIVTDELSDWKDFFPSKQVMTVAQYLDGYPAQGALQVINLCRDLSYMEAGYYCSLMAEARGHRVIPTVMTVNDLSQSFMYRFRPKDFGKNLAAVETIQTKIFFGKTELSGFERVARQLFERFMVPVLEVSLRRINGQWQLEALHPFPFQALSDSEQDRFGEALEAFSQKVWRQPKRGKRARYDIALLVDPDEAMPPSDPSALKRFVRAADRLGINMETIGPADMARLGEFDGLFIRATTSISNYTYRFAQAAQNLGLVVMDDPESIMKCTNKVFLTELLAQHKVPRPQSRILRRGAPELVEEAKASIGYPMVLKVPDGAFSVGVVKVRDDAELEKELDRLYAKSALLLAQAYIPTEYDWRIGVLNRQPLFACRYYMSRGHWQIYQHHGNGRVSSGGFDAVDLKQVPKAVMDAALKAANLIGSGLYGVDVKERDGQVFVIEVNDNPSIDRHVEDAFLGELLYDRIVTEFLRRIQMRGFETR